MYHHVKKLMYTVRVDVPDPKFGNMLLEQFGGANGELAAAMQYSIQGIAATGSQNSSKFTNRRWSGRHTWRSRTCVKPATVSPYSEVPSRD